MRAAFVVAQAAVRKMLEAPDRSARGGVVINISSQMGHVAGPDRAVYAATKHGLEGMTKAMAIDHGRQGVRINCICTGDTETPMEHEDARNRGMTWEAYVAAASERPLGRMGEPIEIARAVLFLACEESSFITGAVLPVDGGGVAG